MRLILTIIAIMLTTSSGQAQNTGFSRIDDTPLNSMLICEITKMSNVGFSGFNEKAVLDPPKIEFVLKLIDNYPSSLQFTYQNHETKLYSGGDPSVRYDAENSEGFIISFENNVVSISSFKCKN